MFIRFGYESLSRLAREVANKTKEGYAPCGQVLSVPMAGGRTLYFATMKPVENDGREG